MRKETSYFITAIILLCFVSSCGSKNCEASEGLRISTISFSASEIDTIVLRRFVKGSNFSSLADSVILDPSNAYFQFPYTTKDTSYLGVLDPKILLTSKYDYQVFFPAVGKLVKITDINEPQLKEKRGLPTGNNNYCVNSILSFKQDGTIVEVLNLNNQVYIHR